MRRWLIATAACGLGCLAALLALVLATDVFALFGTRASAIPVPQNLRLSTGGDRAIKALAIAALKEPLDVLFLGSSRVVFGFDPACRSLEGLRAYNAGLNGSHSDEAAEVLHYALDHGPKIARVVWNIDFEEFFREREGAGDFAQSGFAGASPLSVQLRHALTYEALRKSLAAIFGGQSFYMDVNGFYHYDRQAPANLDNGRDFSALPTLRDWFPHYLLTLQDRFAIAAEQRFARLEEAIREARGRGVAVDIVLMPTHVARRALFDLAGLQPRFELWKRRLAESVAAAAEGEGAPLRAFDFTEIGEIARARFGPGGPLERSPLFFEALHPKPIVGEMILARLLDRGPRAKFGDSLAETTRPERLAADRAALARWQAENPTLVATIAAVVQANDHRDEPLVATVRAEASFLMRE
ncbi:hypothetical protein [Methylosinus trichosporium]|uniref:Uncharacterized protein n=2 Tax=Methylocystaceae TaxID=31993 RepID=A0A2D2CYB7_METT3|nr:hypothetical protein [Methylosinus trichosporium]ATQ67639.1 hypothetical protein CQW49_06865 [Methylosinus trichosporium OB3b]OBS51758.1 hypothetical protein A8B73_14560 [Methylosinus sp. 3S-1]